MIRVGLWYRWMKYIDVPGRFDTLGGTGAGATTALGVWCLYLSYYPII